MIDQSEFWNGLAGARWVREQAGLDEMLRPFGAAALDVARVTPDEAVVDLGCGCGETSLALATLVGPRGRVVGLDVSRSRAVSSRSVDRGGAERRLTRRPSVHGRRVPQYAKRTTWVSLLSALEIAFAT
jgi:SAM-dependent methyltransferase